jgi:hypothetical protein
MIIVVTMKLSDIQGRNVRLMNEDKIMEPKAFVPAFSSGS